MPKTRHAALYRYTRLTLTRKLRLLRERNRMSMKKIAALIGVAGPKELNGNPELLDLALRVACARGVPFSDLMK
jgi:transcriptional regulator with XRE-family HTH domain